MKIALIGASAGVGLETLKYAISRGHDVRALSRSPIEGIDAQSYTHVMGSATRPAALQTVLSDIDVAVVTLGTGKSMKATELYTDFAKALLSLNLDRAIPIIVLTGFGAGDSFAYYPFYIRPIFKLFLGKVYDNKTRMENMLTQSQLNWEIVRPGLLTNGEMTSQYQVYPSLTQGMKIGSISRADVAHYLVGEAENPRHLKQYPALSYY